MVIFKRGKYYYSISDKQPNYIYHIIKFRRINKEDKIVIKIVDKRRVRTKYPKRIKRAILNGKFKQFRKIGSK